MGKTVNNTIGLISCPMRGHRGEVRRQVNGLLYWQCECGKPVPNRPKGQDWLLNNTAMFTAEEVEKFNEFPKVAGLSTAPDEWKKPFNGSEPVNDSKLEPEPVNASDPLRPLDPPDEPEPQRQPEPDEEELPDWLQDEAV